MIGTKDRLLETTEPNIDELALELQRAYSDNRNNNRIRSADETRYAYWHGQTDDGRKHAKEVGAPVHPWEGASDTRILLADHYCEFYASLLAGADARCALNVNPTEAGDIEAASGVQLYMSWLVNTLMAPNWDRELDLVKQYAGHYGWAGVHTKWCRSYQNSAKTITMATLARSMGLPEGGEEQLAAVMDQQSEFLGDLFAAQNPSLKASEVRKHFKELRTNGKTVIELPEVVRDMPEIIALKPFYELLFPPETREVQDARAVFRRDSIPVSELEDMVGASGWDEEWVDAVKRTAGKQHQQWDRGLSPTARTDDQVADTRHLIEVCYAYSRRVDEDGRPGVYLTIFSPYHTKNPDGSEAFARHDLVPECKGKIPISVFTRESTTRELIESRGIPEICSTWQSEIKGQSDMLFDRSSLTVLPPLKVPSRYGNRISIGPGRQLAEQRPNDIQWMEPPKAGPTDALANINAARLRSDEYFGLPNPNLEPTVAQLKNQYQVNRWLNFKSEVLNDVWGLVQRFGRDDRFAEVTGTGRPIPRDPDRYNFTLTFDVRELDSEFTQKQLQAVTELVAPMDQMGVLNREKLVEFMLRSINPTYPEHLMLSVGDASQQMFKEENNNVALMSLGNPPELRENDPTAQVRAQFVTQIIQANPKYQRQLQEDPNFQQQIETYLKNLNMSVMQQQNAVTGRLGVQSNG